MVTDALQVVVAVPLPKVPVYVIAAEGKIVSVGVDPPETGVAFPMFWLIEPKVAFTLVQLTTTDCPGLIAEGDTESVHTGPEGGVGGITVTVVMHVAVWPFAPLAMPV